MWWENGMGALFAPQVKWRSNDVLQSAMTCPEALYGVAVLNAIVGGATVYSFEYCDRVIRRGRPTPLLQKTLHPLLRKLVHESLVPDRETVRGRIRVVYHATDPDAPELAGPGEELFRGLYGNPLPDEQIKAAKYASRWLPTTGRYYYLPILPKHAPEAALALFPNVITSESYPRLFPDKEAKTAYFDRIYPHDTGGTAWQAHLDGRWYVANPNENADRNVEVRIDGLTATLTPHTYAIIEDTGDSLRIETDNLRVDNHLWDGGWEGAGPAFDRYCDSPDYSDRRENVFVMHGVGDQRPDLEIASTDEGFSYQERWDRECREYAVTVRHCGWVTMVMRKE